MCPYAEDPQGRCQNISTKHSCVGGQLIDDNDQIIDMPNPVLGMPNPIGISPRKYKRYPDISSIGCNGCDSLRNAKCSLDTYKDLIEPKLRTGMKIADAKFINSVRLNMAIIAFIDTIFTLLAVYLIFKQSDKSMKEYRWFLLNISVGFVEKMMRILVLVVYY